ncbi:MAG: hypothetical protein ACRDKA_02255 [Actinomycetota bacterium]
MSRCPVCGSVRIVLVLSPTGRSFCAECGSRWLQDGSAQRQVERSDGSGVAPARPA